MIFNITVNENKNVSYEKIIVNQYENEIDQFEFVLPFADFSWVGVFKSQKMKKLELPIIDNKIVIGNSITSIAGDWTLIVVGKKYDIVFVSDEIHFKTDKNYLNMKSMQEIDENIELLYAELQETLNKLNDTGLNEISSVVEELISINQKIEAIPQNDYTDTLQEIKGLLTVADALADEIL